MDDKILIYVVMGGLLWLVIRFFARNTRMASIKMELSRDLASLGMKAGSDWAYDNLALQYFLHILGNCRSKSEFDLYRDCIRQSPQYFRSESSYQEFLDQAKILRKSMRF